MVTKIDEHGTAQDVISKYDAFLFDCDGVIYGGDEVFDGVKEILDLLRKQGKKLLFVTNNATQSRRTFKEKFDKLGIPVEADEIFGSSYATVAYMKYTLKIPTTTTIYAVGEAGLIEELESEGYKHKGGNDPEDLSDGTVPSFDEIKSDPSIGAVVCGLDRTVSYKKLAKAHRFLTDNKDVHFLCTNDDKTFPTKTAFYPGAGFVLAALTACTGREATVCGKPHKPMMDAVLKANHLDPKRTLMVGDRLDTDILFGYNSGLDTLHVLTGVHQEKDHPMIEGKGPTYFADSLGALSG